MTQNLQTSSTSALTVNDQILIAERDKKIRDYSDPYPIINSFLAEFMLIMNISEVNKPSIEFQRIVIDNIAKYHGNKSLKEMHLAIELNVNGKLSKKIEFFGKISIEYFADCFKLYEEKKQAEILREKTKIEPPTQRKEIGYHNGRAYYIEIEKWVKSTGKLPLFWDWSKCYSFLLENGDLANDFPKSSMLDIFDKFKSKGMSEATVGRFATQGEKQLGKMIEFDLLSSDNVVKHECRKYVVQQYLTKKFEITN